MFRELSEDDWMKKYQPVMNHLRDNEESDQFETYGEELEFVLAQNDKNVWTEMDGDNGVYIVNGYHYVNRICYYVTEKPWEDGEDIQITLLTYEVCDCYDPEDEDTEPDDDCEKCYGDGTYTVWEHDKPDTEEEQQ